MSNIRNIFDQGTQNWRKGLIKDARGNTLALESNAMIIMRNHPDMICVFGLDEFHQKPYLMRTPPWGNREDKNFPRPVSDADQANLLAWLQQNEIHLRGRGPTRTVLASVVQDRVFHPVRDYLGELIWDHKDRLNTWLTEYFGVVPILNYTTTIGRCWLISAVARIYQPGCIAKYVLVIEGPQDLGKSTALRILGDPWFTDDIATLGSKDSQLQVGNAWIVELAELDSIRRADISAIKAFISRSVDQFRPPYGEHIISQKRQCVLAATVNPAEPYIHDDTGAVRFWPATATKILLDKLREDRDQIWAEAVYLYKSGMKWWPGVEFNPSNEQETRSETAETDPWYDKVKEWLFIQTAKNFTSGEILEKALGFTWEKMDLRAERRLGRILRKLGYVSGGVRVDGVEQPVRRWKQKLA